tara:strand:+ start:1128 stop:1769 length:642 start_codon:yes stop_codon:yes gene_type:complete
MLNENQVIQLRDSLENLGYCQINDYFSPDLLNFLSIASEITNLNSYHDIARIIKSPEGKPTPHIQYAPIIGETLLASLTPLYSQITGKNLVPTYSYWRHYKKQSQLIPHRDRLACQYSCTIQINKSEEKDWPIKINSLSNEIFEQEVPLGDVILYKGVEVLHWRDPLEYDWSDHIFLHWVDGDDEKYKSEIFDGRSGIGIPKEQNSSQVFLEE